MKIFIEPSTLDTPAGRWVQPNTMLGMWARWSPLVRKDSFHFFTVRWVM